jgi:hypothetical protein
MPFPVLLFGDCSELALIVMSLRLAALLACPVGMYLMMRMMRTE